MEPQSMKHGDLRGETFDGLDDENCCLKPLDDLALDNHALVATAESAV